MQTFKYSFFPKLIYKYGIIPANLILLFYLIGSSMGLVNDWLFLLPLVLSGIMMYALNKFYLKIYRTFPFTIDVDNEKLICKDLTVGSKFSGKNLSCLLKPAPFTAILVYLRIALLIAG